MNYIEQMYRFPVKGLSGEPLSSVMLQAGLGFPCDRKFAITNGTWAFDRDNYEPRPKTDFIALMQYEHLAALKTTYREDENLLSIDAPGRGVLRFKLDDATDRDALSAFIAAHLNGKAPGDPVLVDKEGMVFTDVSVVSPSMMHAISLINLTSLEALQLAVGKPLHPLRFRANVYYRGAEPWEELRWVGKEITLGQARAKVTLKTRRCAATNVNPVTAERDLGIPQTLIKTFRHGDLGVYAEIIEGGAVSLGDAIVLCE